MVTQNFTYKLDSKPQIDRRDRMKNTMNQNETVELGIIIKQHCHNIDGYAVYDQGWDDDKIVAEANKTINGRRDGFVFVRSNVDGLRRSTIGNFPPVRQANPVMKNRMTDLEHRVNRLEMWARLRPVGAFPNDPMGEILPMPRKASNHG